MKIYALFLGEYATRDVVAVFDSLDKLMEYSRVLQFSQRLDYSEFELNPDPWPERARIDAEMHRIEIETMERRERRRQGRSTVDDELLNRLDDIHAQFHRSQI